MPLGMFFLVITAIAKTAATAIKVKVMKAGLMISCATNPGISIPVKAMTNESPKKVRSFILGFHFHKKNFRAEEN